MTRRVEGERRQRLIKALLDRDGDLCHWCKRPMLTAKLPTRYQPPNAVTIEHLVPIVCGGTNEWDNLALACRRCNNARGSSLYPPIIRGLEHTHEPVMQPKPVETWPLIPKCPPPRRKR